MTPVKSAVPETRVLLPVLGMHAPSCVERIEDAVGAVSGVSGVTADLASRTVAVRFSNTGKTLKGIRRAVEKEGFDVLGASESLAEAESMVLHSETEQERLFARRFVVCGILSAPLLLSGFLQLSPYTALLIALPLQFWGGWPFHQGFARSLLRGSADLNTLVSLSTWAAFLHSATVTFVPYSFPAQAREFRWETVCMLIMAATLARWISARTKRTSHEALMRIQRQSPRTVRVVRDGVESVVPSEVVRPGDTIRVRPGEQIGADGVVIHGESGVDERLLGGCKRPVEKSAGSRVWAGTFNKTGILDLNVRRCAPESVLAGVVRTVREGQASKTRISSPADHVAAILVPVACLAAALSATLWAIYGPEPKIVFGLAALAAVFAAAAPVSLGLAEALGSVAGLVRARMLGVRFRDPDVIHKASLIDTVIFGKTGVVTQERSSVTGIDVYDGTREDLLALMRAAGERSSHPILLSAAAHARAEGVEAVPVDSFESSPGGGTLLRCGGGEIRVGSLSWLSEQGLMVPLEGRLEMESCPDSVLAVAARGKILGAIRFSETVKPSAREAITGLKAMGIDVILVTGDRRNAANRAADACGIKSVLAELSSEERAGALERLRLEGRRVAVVGRSLQDAPVLSRAYIGVGLASSDELAFESADMVLPDDDLRTIVRIIALSRRTRRTIRENLFFSLAPNVLLMALAAGAFFPVFSALSTSLFIWAAMVSGLVMVTVNSWRMVGKWEK